MQRLQEVSDQDVAAIETASDRKRIGIAIGIACFLAMAIIVGTLLGKAKVATPTVLQNADLGNTQLGGAFQIAQPDAFLLALQEGFDIAHRREGDQVLLFRPHMTQS